MKKAKKMEDFLKGGKKKEPEFYLSNKKPKFYKRKWFLFAVVPLFMVLIAGGVMAFKTGYILNKISLSDESGLRSLFNVLPIVGKDEDVKGEEEGRINILLLGMRGTEVLGGDLLADTIMLASYKIDENKLALISIPRDLYVNIPDKNYKAKINAVHVYGEENGQEKGLENMKKVVGEITGLPVHYAVSIDFNGFKELVNAIGGVEVYLETPFYETSQFVKGQECGIQFTLPAGVNLLDGEKALCYARARENTSDFDRAKRQQLIVKALKDKLITLGIFTDFGKLNNILNVLGNNVRTDMASHEMKKFYEKYSSVIKDAQIFQRVLENSEEGMLMVPSDAPESAGYILIPRAGWDNYSEIQTVCRDIFTLPVQSDINPVKQYSRPQPKQEDEKEDEKKDDKSDKEEDKEDEDKDKDEDEEKEEEEEEEEDEEEDK